MWDLQPSRALWVPDYEKNGYQVFKKNKPNFINKKLLEAIETEKKPGRVLEADGKTLRSQFNIHNEYPEIISEVISKDLIEKSRMILGSSPIIYQSHINFKKSNLGEGFSWHSDFSYWKAHDGMLEPRAISVLIPFENHNQTNGGLTLMQGSHKFYYPNNLTTETTWQIDNIRHDSDEKLRQDGLVPVDILSSIQKDKFVPIELDESSYAIFDANTWHSSSKNTSEKNRCTLFLVLISEKTKFDNSLKNYRPHYISCRKQIHLIDYL